MRLASLRSPCPQCGSQETRRLFTPPRLNLTGSRATEGDLAPDAPDTAPAVPANGYNLTKSSIQNLTLRGGPAISGVKGDEIDLSLRNVGFENFGHAVSMEDSAINVENVTMSGNLNGFDVKRSRVTGKKLRID